MLEVIREKNLPITIGSVLIKLGSHQFVGRANHRALDRKSYEKALELFEGTAPSGDGT
jgi:hypothetical protein